MKKLLLVLFLLISASVSAQNLPEISTDRPDQSESPDVIPVKHAQVEAGLSYENYKYDFGTLNTYKLSINSYNIPDLLVRYGAVNNLELRFGTSVVRTEGSITPTDPNISASSSTTFGPLMIGGKLNLMEEQEILPATSLLLEVEMPALTIDESNSYFNPAVKFCFSNGLSSNAELSYNLGIQVDNDGSSAQTTGIYTLSLGLSLSDKVGMYGEVFGFLPFESYATATHYIDGGFTYLVKNNLQFDISGGYGLQKDVDYYYIAAGVSLRMPN